MDISPHPQNRAARRPLRLLSAASVLCLALTAAISVSTTPANAAPSSTTSAPLACTDPVFSTPVRAETAQAKAPVRFAAAARTNGESLADFTETAEDPTLWLDPCGKAYYIEASEADDEIPAEPPVASADVPAGVDVMTLASSPTSTRTIYLDFTGRTVTGTAWNSGYNQPSMTYEPFSQDSKIDTDFAFYERRAIYEAWSTVADDYAPFDVNVTTIDPGAAGLGRSSLSDTTYGARVLITNGGYLYDNCDCGGLAYIGVYNRAGAQHDAYQPAFVFGDAMGGVGWYVGEAASHEAGHNFGLSHDGEGDSAYATGEGAWAPIMGGSYGKAMSQWSAGEYDGATNSQDDLAVIAQGAPLRADDYPAGSQAPVLTPGTPTRGLIEQRADVDTFTFTGSGATSVTVTPASSETADLDVAITIRDSSGAFVARDDPLSAPDAAAHPVDAGYSANWSARLSPRPETYTVEIDGTGSGDLTKHGGYSDYASLGRYTVNFITTTRDAQGAETLGVSGQQVVETAPGRSDLDAVPFTVTGGSAPYTWSATGLLDGLTINPATGHISGMTTAETSRWGIDTFVGVVDSSGHAVSRIVRLVSANIIVPDVLNAPSDTFSTTQGSTVEHWLNVTGAASNVTWSATSALPPGLNLHFNGLIYGAAAVPGTYSFTTRVVSETGAATSRVTVVVTPNGVVPVAVNNPPSTFTPTNSLLPRTSQPSHSQKPSKKCKPSGRSKASKQCKPSKKGKSSSTRRRR